MHVPWWLLGRRSCRLGSLDSSSQIQRIVCEEDHRIAMETMTRTIRGGSLANRLYLVLMTERTEYSTANRYFVVGARWRR